MFNAQYKTSGLDLVLNSYDMANARWTTELTMQAKEWYQKELQINQ